MPINAATINSTGKDVHTDFASLGPDLPWLMLMYPPGGFTTGRIISWVVQPGTKKKVGEQASSRLVHHGQLAMTNGTATMRGLLVLDMGTY
jgi:hypothetical protein